MSSPLAIRLRKLMAVKNHTPTSLANLSGVDVSLIRRYLYGEIGIGVKNAILLAEALEVDVSKIVCSHAA